LEQLYFSVSWAVTIEAGARTQAPNKRETNTIFLMALKFIAYPPCLIDVGLRLDSALTSIASQS
jgi:hypothetical protein